MTIPVEESSAIDPAKPVWRQEQRFYGPKTQGPEQDAYDEAAEAAEKVYSPLHYSSGRLEVIYQIQDALGPVGFKAYCIGNALKYLNRSSRKAGDEDLKKAYVYLGWATNGLPEPVNGKVPQ